MNKSEIKFRALKKFNNKFVYGFYFQRHTAHFIYETKSYLIDKVTPSLQEEHHVHPHTVSQYIGLKDINGKEIYVGDIVQFYTRSNPRTPKKSIVSIEDGLLYPFYDGMYVDDEQGDWFVSDKGFEIIGNIYENEK